MSKLFCALIFLVCTPLVYADKKVVSLGTGGVTGVYYPTGGSLCRMVNRLRENQDIRCTLEATQGSVSNIVRVLDGSLDLGIAQSNWLYNYYVEGLKLNPVNGAHKKVVKIEENEHSSSAKPAQLRTLLVLYPEYFTVIVPEHSNIQTLEDIKGKRISMGTAGSSLRATMNAIMVKKGWHREDFKQVINLAPEEQASALCTGLIDVMIYTVGHPSGAAREATQECKSRLVSIKGAVIEQLIEENSYFRWATIPGALYEGNIKSVKTFGVNATLFSSTLLPDDVAYTLVKSTFEQFNEFRSLHPAFSRLIPEEMVQGPFAAPLHEGAIKYFKEIGLM